jgi:murein DD-endopeptidase MepM/ murein hydrolase activator NlpD
MMVALALAAALGTGGCTSEPSAASQVLQVERLEQYHPPVRTFVAAGDTLESVSRRLDGRDWVLWRDALSLQIDPKRLRPGTEFRGWRSPAGRLLELAVVLDPRSEIQLQRGPEGVTATRIERPLERETVRIEGTVESSLFAAMDAAGGNAELAVRVAEIYQWDIDFFRDLRTGDSFVVIADRQSVDGGFLGWGTVYATRFTNRGRALDAVAYPDNSGQLGYYDLEGRPLRKQFLRSPLKFSRITSRFSMSRFHPVLKRRMPHYGVDYGAPTGTPVQVTANGTVTFAGRKGGGGNMVTVRHANGYETNYLHLSGFARGIRRGVRVAQGQVLGYVGSTGLSTGPHLDYRVRLNGSWVNPLTISSPPVEPLAEGRLQRYLAHALAVLSLIEGREPPVGARC